MPGLKAIAFYRSPERSISYYNKGEILGVLLDLRIRQLTRRQQVAARSVPVDERCTTPSSTVIFPIRRRAQAAESVTGQSFAEFFRDYVAGVKEIPYDDFFRFVGLQLATENVTVADAGFTSTANLDGETRLPRWRRAAMLRARA